MTYFEAYLLTRLDSFANLFLLIMILSSIGLFASTMCWIFGGNEWEDEKIEKVRRNTKPFIKIFAILFVIFNFANALTPTTKEAAFIYIAPAIVNNQDIQKTIKKLPELSGLGLEYLGEILKEEIKETKKEVINK